MMFRENLPVFTKEQMRERARIREIIRVRDRVNSSWTEVMEREGKAKAAADEKEPEPREYSAKNEEIEELRRQIGALKRKIVAAKVLGALCTFVFGAMVFMVDKVEDRALTAGAGAVCAAGMLTEDTISKKGISKIEGKIAEMEKRD